MFEKMKLRQRILLGYLAPLAAAAGRHESGVRQPAAGDARSGGGGSFAPDHGRSQRPRLYPDQDAARSARLSAGKKSDLAPDLSGQRKGFHQPKREAHRPGERPAATGDSAQHAEAGATNWANRTTRTWSWWTQASRRKPWPTSAAEMASRNRQKWTRNGIVSNSGKPKS